MNEQVFSIASAARDFFGGQISPWTLRSWIRTGRLRAFKAGARVLIKRNDLEAFMREREISPPPEVA
jgi:excisionase family DNA binding protein